MDQKHFLHELLSMRPGNDLYAAWIKYAAELTDADVKNIVENGLTYQANAIRSMIKEIIAGGIVPPKLLSKLDALVAETEKNARNLR